MKLFAAIFVLFVASFQIPYTAKGHEGGDVDSSEADIGLLRKDLREERSELRRKSISDVKERKRRNNLKNRITKLEAEVTNLKSEQASSQQVFLNLQEGLLTEERMRQQLEKGLAELKTAMRLSGAELSEFQVAVVRNNTNQQRLCECPTRSQNITEKANVEIRTKAWRRYAADGDGCHKQLSERKRVPVLRFSQAYGDTPEHVVIEAGGAEVRDGPRRAVGTNVRTDGRLPADRCHYWEAELVWSLVSEIGVGWYWVGVIGVRREGSDFGYGLGRDDKSWAVGIWYNFGLQKWRYQCYHGGKHYVIEPVNTEPVKTTRPEASHRLGFLLVPADRTVTAVDVNTNTRICSSFPAVDAGSQPLVPMVGFWSSYFQRRFRLLAVDPSGLPGAVIDLLHN